MDQRNLTKELRDECWKVVDLRTLESMITSGAKSPQPTVEVKPSDICFFSYNSGTTGKPKGAMIPHSVIVAGLAGVKRSLPSFHPRILSYLPLAHVFERQVFTFTIFEGGEYGFFNGNIKKLKEDLALLQPTMFVSVPRLYLKFYDAIKAKFAQATGLKKMLIDRAVTRKLHHYRTGGHYKHKTYDTLVFNKVRAILGGKVEYCLTGSAPISSEVKEFLKICFACQFAEGYGQTEALAAEFLAHREDPAYGHCGGPLTQNEMKVVDVPSMNYFSTDVDENGDLAPRGEICVRGANVIPCFYKNEEKSAEMRDKDGWLHSEDIGVILPGSGALKVVDRMKNIFKLSQGEYVAPDKLESIYKTIPAITDIFVHRIRRKVC